MTTRTKDPRSRIELPTLSSAVFVNLFAVFVNLFAMIVYDFQSKQALLPQTAFQEVTFSFAILSLGVLLGHAMRVMTTDSRRPTRTVCGHGWWRPSPYDGKLPIAIARRLPPGPVAPRGEIRALSDVAVMCYHRSPT